MRISLGILAVISVISLGILTNFYQVSIHPIGTEISPEEVTEERKLFSLPSPSEKQNQLLNFANFIATTVGFASPEILQGIIFQESRAGGLKSYKVAGHEFGLKANERYYGVSQMKLSAAKDVLKKYPYLLDKYGFHTTTDEEIIANLILNDEFNIEAASLYLKLISEKYGSNKSYVIAAFNKGPNGAKKIENPSALDYVRKVKNHIKNLNLGR